MSDILDFFGIKEKDLERMRKFIQDNLEHGKEYSQHELVATAVKGLEEERYEKIGFNILENPDVIVPRLGLKELEKNGCKFYKLEDKN